MPKLLAVILFVILMVSRTAKAFTLCYENDDYVPWVYGGGEAPLPDKRRRGALVDFVNHGARASGLEIDFLRLPWKRCLAGLRDNSIDAAMASVYVADRESFARYPGNVGEPDTSMSLARVDYPLFHDQNANWIFDGQTFSRKDLRIGAPLGYAVHERLAKLGLDSIDKHNPVNGLQLVRHKKLHAYVVERNIGRNLVKQLGLVGLTDSATPVMTSNWYVILSHGWHDRNRKGARDFWRHTADFRKSHGAQIIDTYLSID